VLGNLSVSRSGADRSVEKSPFRAGLKIKFFQQQNLNPSFDYWAQSCGRSIVCFNLNPSFKSRNAPRQSAAFGSCFLQKGEKAVCVLYSEKRAFLEGVRALHSSKKVKIHELFQPLCS